MKPLFIIFDELNVAPVRNQFGCPKVFFKHQDAEGYAQRNPQLKRGRWQIISVYPPVQVAENAGSTLREFVAVPFADGFKRIPLRKKAAC